MSKNVYYNKQFKRWHARIYTGMNELGHPKFIHVGRFMTKELAEEACLAFMAEEAVSA